MGFTRAAARDLLKASLLDAVSVFDSDATAQAQHLDRHLDVAVADFNRVAPRLLSEELQLVASVGNYTAPEAALRFHSTELIDDQNEREPWDEYRIPVVPTPLLTTVNGVRCWQFRPTPTDFMLQRIGSAYPYTYVAAHALADDADDTTIEAAHLPLFVLRALVQSLMELAVRNAHKPMATRDPTVSQTRNGTPAALADQLFRLWEQQMRPAADLYGTLRLAGGGR